MTLMAPEERRRCNNRFVRRRWTSRGSEISIYMLSAAIRNPSCRRSIVQLVDSILLLLQMGPARGVPFAVPRTQVLPDKTTLTARKIADVYFLWRI